MTEPSEEEPKLIIDEDWKTQVQREKEKLKDAGEAKSAASDEPADAPVPEPASEKSEQAELPPPPPASLPLLISMLVTQAMASLGQVPGDDGQPLPINLPYAKHFIDLLGVLEEKTKGNLAPEEAKYISDTLHQLRMFFISVSKK